MLPSFFSRWSRVPCHVVQSARPGLCAIPTAVARPPLVGPSLRMSSQPLARLSSSLAWSTERGAPRLAGPFSFPVPAAFNPTSSSTTVQVLAAVAAAVVAATASSTASNKAAATSDEAEGNAAARSFGLVGCEAGVPESVSEFYRESTPPPGLAGFTSEMDKFVALNSKRGTPIAVVTSGGTSVPLEKNTVRFVDNFSTGTRGALCVESLLRSGYAVILLRRDGSLRPFHRLGAKAAAHLEDYVGFADDGGACVHLPEDVASEAAQYAACKAEQRIMEVPFNSVSDYLHVLRAAAVSAGSAGPNTLFLLAAAVSDFYVPEHLMAVHKIQSQGGAETLKLELQGVPKTLGVLRRLWAPKSFVVSFKLETDPDMLLKKARGALDKYHMDLVVANMLSKRYEEVTLVDPKGTETVRSQSASVEEAFLEVVTRRHKEFCKSSRNG